MIPSEIHPHSFIHHWLLPNQALSPGEVRRAVPPSVAALEFLDYRTSLKYPGRCCILPVPHALQRQLHSDQEFPAHFIFMQACIHVNCQQLWRRCWQGSRGEELMLHQALLLSPSGAGLEATAAICGDASQSGSREPLCAAFLGKSQARSP